jgi:uncharacterized membrane protein YeaQ/YmgE (transglycosylase-associated protein family)
MLGFLLIGAICGWLAATMMRGRGFGFFGNMAVGVVGAVIGGYLLQQLGFPVRPTGWIASFVGSVVLLFFVSLFKSK